MTFDFIKISSTKNKVYELTLNNPKSRNALNSVMLEEIQVFLEKINDEKNCRVLIITGVGKAFSAGADLEWMKKSIELSHEDNKKDALKFSKILKSIDDLYCPTVGIINGHAFGGGLGILSVCDFTIANSQSKFCFSEVKLGLIPAMIGPYILRSIGYSNAKKLFLTGEVFDTDKAISLNLIGKAVDEKNIEYEKNKIINQLLLAAPNAQLEIKSYLQDIYSKNINMDLVNKAAESISRIRASDEGQEGIKAFLNKSKPVWQDEIS